jgi:hypothetical protein
MEGKMEKDTDAGIILELLSQLCDACRRLNPQHAECTGCGDTEDARERTGTVGKKL